MAKVLCDVIMYIFESILLYQYAESLFISRIRKPVRFLAIVLINMCLCIAYQANITLLNGLLIFLADFIIFHVLYKVRLRTAIFHAVMFVSVMVLSEIAVINLCSVIFDDFDAMATNFDAYIFVISTSKLIYSAIMLIIKRICGFQKGQKYNDRFFWILFLFPLSTVPVVLLVFFVEDSIDVSYSVRIVISSIFVVLLFLNLLVFYIYDTASKNKAELYELKAASLLQEADEKYFETIKKSQEEIRRFSHDTKNHLLQLSYLDDIDEIHRYINGMISEVEKIASVGVSSNKNLNIIIGKYNSICEKKNIKFTVNVKMASLNYIKDVDLSSILNNLLDNAVEAAELCENGYIEMSIFSKNNNFDGIKIRNSCAREPEHIDGKLITSKKDKFFHGLGVTIVKRVLKKYEAMYDWQYFKDKKMFEVSVVLPKGDILRRTDLNK